MRRVIGYSAASAALVVFCGQAAVAQSFTSVPDNAVVLVKVNKLDQTNKKLSALLQQWGIAAMDPQFADPLATAEAKLKIEKGVKADGDLSVIVFNTQNIPAKHEGQPVVVMVPVSDYEAFSSNFADATVDGEITNIMLPENQEPAYMAHWGNYAAISTDRVLVAQKPKASKATGLAAKELLDKDIVAYVNFASFKQQVGALMGMGQMMAMGQVDQMAQQDPDKAKYIPVTKVAMQQLFAGITHVLNETQAITVGVSLADNGVQMTYMAEFAPKTYLGGLVSQWKPAAAPGIVGLPEGKYAFVSSTSFDGATANAIIDDMIGPIVAEAQKMGDDGKPVVDYVDAIKQLIGATKSQSSGVSVGEGAAGKSSLFDMVTVTQGNAEKMKAAQTQMISAQEEFQKAVLPQGQNTQTTIKKNAKTVAGVQFDQAVMSADATKGTPAEQKIVEAMYGEGGMQILWGVASPQAMLAATYKDDARITSAIESAKALKPLVVDAQTKAVAGKLPANAFIMGFAYGDQVMAMVSKGSQAFAGVPLQFDIPANTPPVGVAISAQGTAIREDLFVPSPLIQSITKAAMEQAVKQHQNQQKGGGL